MTYTTYKYLYLSLEACETC